MRFAPAGGQHASACEKNLTTLRARRAMRDFVIIGLRNHLHPKPEDYFLEEGAFAVRGPRCGSQDAILEGLDQELREEFTPEGKNKWRCADCEHRWEDDGIVNRR
jgi:hypothetical protein